MTFANKLAKRFCPNSQTQSHLSVWLHPKHSFQEFFVLLGFTLPTTETRQEGGGGEGWGGNGGGRERQSDLRTFTKSIPLALLHSPHTFLAPLGLSSTHQPSHFSPTQSSSAHKKDLQPGSQESHILVLALAPAGFVIFSEYCQFPPLKHIQQLDFTPESTGCRGNQHL